MRITKSVALLLACAFLGAQEAPKPAAAKPEANDPWQESTFRAFRLRSIGPALLSGRVNIIVVHPGHPATWYAGVASGGVWKTTNAGTTWTPIFQNEGSYSIGDVALDPRDPNVIWVGTGEHNAQRSVGYGHGVYRSADGGRTWKNMGLRQSGNIGRIVIDPRDSNVVYVAAQGPLWSAGGERGLYKTTDGGQTWTQILKISENTGVTDVAMDPFNPDVLLAAAHQRRRHVWTLIHGGPESALYKSNDGGKTWRKITTGLPGGELGRIGLEFSRAQRGLVYAVVEATREGTGTYRSLDSGESWERRSNVAGQPMYYGRVFADPQLAGRVYMMDVIVRVSDDGGATWRVVGDRAKHVDTHAWWIDPKDSNHILAGCDGGIYETWDGGRLWRHMTNLPVMQFYNVAVDNSSPVYYVYGGTQDNNTVGGPSATRGVDGATNNDWFVVTGGDGFVARIDPTDPNIVYAESQYGGLVRLDRRTGERVPIRPVEGKGEPPLRFNWESPYIISPHNPKRLYFGANRLLRSDDRGDGWTPVSGDLTRQVDRNKLPVMGKIWPPEAIAKHQSTSTFGNLTALSESPVKEGLIYTGSDDGLISVTEDGGKAWRKIDKIAGLPDLSPVGSIGVYVQRLVASRHDASKVYALFDNHKNGDFRPYVMKSADKGATWVSIAGNLPENGPALSLAEDPLNPNLLFCGTEFGLYFTVDGGKKWIRLRNNLPTIPVRDLAVQEREGDLVLATFGRGFYVLDDYSPLRQANAQVFEKAAHVFPVKKATAFVQETGKSRGSQGEQLWMAENPPYGATITYWLKETVRTKRQERQERARKDPSLYPTQAELTAEEDEDPPQILLTIADAKGRVVRHLTGPATRGIHRVTWNLRGPAISAAQPQGQRGEQEEEPRRQQPGGALVAPGTYKVTLARKAGGVVTPLNVEETIAVVADAASAMSDADRRARDEFIERALRLQRQVLGALDSANQAKAKLTAIRRALLDGPARPEMIETALKLDARVTAILRKLRGDETLRGLESGAPSTIQSRAANAVAVTRGMTSPPTGTMQANLRIAGEELAEESAKLKALLDELRKFEQALDAAGVPYTQGRYQ